MIRPAREYGAIRVLIFHGYLLRGTGSNVYNANLAQALAGLGHDVHLLCQDRERRARSTGSMRSAPGRAARFDVEPTGSPGSPGAGSVTAYLPDIGGLLPVYVLDRYAGFEVKAFAELSEAELERYIAANVAAVADVEALIGGSQAALANHLDHGAADSRPRRG